MNLSFGLGLMAASLPSLVYIEVLALLLPALSWEPFVILLNKLKFPLHRVFIAAFYSGAHVTEIGRFAKLVIGTGLEMEFKMTEAERIAAVAHELSHWVF
jgi:Zn-dependent protease with chaperone function